MTYSTHRALETFKHCTPKSSYYCDDGRCNDQMESLLLPQKGLAIWCPWGPYSWDSSSPDLTQFKPVLRVISQKLLTGSTHNKRSPERISRDENEGKSLGETEVIKCKYSSDTHNDQSKQDLDSLGGEKWVHEVTGAPASWDSPRALGHPTMLMSHPPPRECLPLPFAHRPQSFPKSSVSFFIALTWVPPVHISHCPPSLLIIFLYFRFTLHQTDRSTCFHIQYMLLELRLSPVP